MANVNNTLEFLTFPEKYRNINFDSCLHTKKYGLFRGLNEDLISKLVLEVSNLRPMHFALNGRNTALTLIGLKLHFLNSSAKYNEYWDIVLQNFLKDCKNFVEGTKKFKAYYNRLEVRSVLSYVKAYN